MPKYTIEFKLELDVDLEIEAENELEAAQNLEQHPKYKTLMDAVRYCNDAVSDVYLYASTVDVYAVDGVPIGEEDEYFIEPHYYDDREDGDLENLIASELDKLARLEDLVYGAKEDD